MTRKMVDYSSRDTPYKSDGKHSDGYSLDIADTLRSLKVMIRSCKVDNDMIIQSQERLFKAQEKQAEVLLALYVHGQP